MELEFCFYKLGNCSANLASFLASFLSFDESLITHMPHNISGNPILLDASPTIERSLGLQAPPVQVDAFADRLMDELFDDVEKILEGSVPPPEPVRIERHPIAPMPVALSQGERTPLEPQRLSFDIAPPPAASEIVARPKLPDWNKPKPQPQKQAKKAVRKSKNSLQKFFVVALCASALATVSVWLANRSLSQRVVASAAQSSQTIATASTAEGASMKEPSAGANRSFAQYLQRSLNNLDRRAASGTAIAAVAAVPYTNNLPANNLPSVAVSGNPARSGTQLPKTPVVINMPTAPTAATGSTPVPNDLSQVLTRLSSVLERLSPNLSRPAVNSQPSQPIAIAQRASTPTEAQRTLRGIAIANDPTQSAVLFEMNGVTQRYYTGESIGSSGWSVVDISNNYVTVRRSGEVRSIAIGQKL